MEFLFHYYLIHAYFKKCSSITAKKMIGEHNNVTPEVNILSYLFKMNRMFFANLKDFSFILLLFSLKIIHFKNIK